MLIKYSLPTLIFTLNLRNFEGKNIAPGSVSLEAKIFGQFDEIHYFMYEGEKNVEAAFSNEYAQITSLQNGLTYKIDLGSTSPKDTCDSMNGACQVSVLNSQFFDDGVNLKEGRGYMGLLSANFVVE